MQMKRSIRARKLQVKLSPSVSPRGFTPYVGWEGRIQEVVRRYCCKIKLNTVFKAGLRFELFLKHHFHISGDCFVARQKLSSRNGRFSLTF